MAPSVVEIPVEAPVIGKTLLKVAQKAPTASPIVPVKSTGAKNTLASPLKISPDSALLKLKHFDTTVPVGTDFPRGSVQITDLLTSPNSDDLLRDLAALVSQRGVVFFRAQHIDIEGQKELVTRLGELSGKPATSKLHIHPNTPEDSKLGDDIFPITSGQREKFKPNGIVNPLPSKKEFDEDKRASSFWVSFPMYDFREALLTVPSIPISPMSASPATILR